MYLMQYGININGLFTIEGRYLAIKSLILGNLEVFSSDFFPLPS